MAFDLDNPEDQESFKSQVLGNPDAPEQNLSVSQGLNDPEVDESNARRAKTQSSFDAWAASDAPNAIQYREIRAQQKSEAGTSDEALEGRGALAVERFNKAYLEAEDTEDELRALTDLATELEQTGSMTRLVEALDDLGYSLDEPETDELLRAIDQQMKRDAAHEAEVKLLSAEEQITRADEAQRRIAWEQTAERWGVSPDSDSMVTKVARALAGYEAATGVTQDDLAYADPQAVRDAALLGGAVADEAEMQEFRKAFGRAIIDGDTNVSQGLHGAPGQPHQPFLLTDEHDAFVEGTIDPAVVVRRAARKSTPEFARDLKAAMRPTAAQREYVKTIEDALSSKGKKKR